MKAESKITDHYKVWIVAMGLIIGLLVSRLITVQFVHGNADHVVQIEQAHVNAELQPKTRGLSQDHRHYNFLTSFIMLEAKCHKQEPMEQTASNANYMRISDLFKVIL
jgi:hypothetical protein